MSQEQQKNRGSYEKINYRLRPAKCIQRKMLVEAFRKLSPFGKVSDYRYIGFGSTYFGDFVLIHRALGIENMVSIERDAMNEHRFTFNRPFRCIEMYFEESNVALPKLNWDARSIVWLDYDGRLTVNVLEDISTVIGVAPAGTLLVVSVNANPTERPPEVPPAELAAYRIQKLKEEVTDKHVRLGLNGKALQEWGTASEYRNIINDVVASTVSARNGSRTRGTKFKFGQLFNFHYADGARMLTVGGILYDEGQDNMFAACGFSDLDFIRTADDPYKISAPNLTLRETRHLDSQLPKGENVLLLQGVPQEDIDAYSVVYRYFPAFAETDL